MQITGTHIKTGRSEFDWLYPTVRSFLEQDAMDVHIDGERIRGFHAPDTKSIWIRDYSDMLRGIKYFEEDLKSTVSHFAETQARNGRIFDYFTTSPEKLPCERENWTKYVRVPVEADVEFRFVKAAYLAWQATGDDAWIKDLLPCLEKALQYVLSHPWRFDEETGLVKRPYTIDTWDFAYTAGRHEWLQFQIDEDTFWGIMHGDNSGYYEAFRIMERLNNHFEDADSARLWRKRAQKLRSNLNRVCWNGRFYTHFYKLTPVEIPEVEEEQQLSLSNPMDINRGAADQEMAASIIREYQKRGQQSQAFAPWFSIDPPFPDGIFGDEKLKAGAYVNGGIMPLVGGELAKASFDRGFEEYGVEILQRYYRMVSASGESYLWYFPDGTPASKETSTSPEALPTDGWGSSAMLYALIEGLAGVEDRHKLFEQTRLSPRWPAAGVENAEVRVEYAASGAWLGYEYLNYGDKLVLNLNTPNSHVQFHVLLPRDVVVTSVSLERNKIKHRLSLAGSSRYCDFEASLRDTARIVIRWE